MSVKSNWFITSINSLISLLGFSLIDRSIGERGVLKSPTISVSGLMAALSFSNVSFTYVGQKHQIELMLWGPIFILKTSKIINIVPLWLFQGYANRTAGNQQEDSSQHIGALIGFMEASCWYVWVPLMASGLLVGLL